MHGWDILLIISIFLQLITIQRPYHTTMQLKMEAIKGLKSSVVSPLQLMVQDPSEILNGEEKLDLPVTQLEAMADAFQERLIQTGKVEDRQLRNRPVPQSFQGNDAVDVLVKLLQGDHPNVTRAQAVQVGNEIQDKFHFFVNNRSTKTHSIPLRDSEQELYQFDHNLPIQVYQMRKQYPSNWDKVTLLENRVPLGDHNGLLKVHSNSFLAKEAVDVLMEAKLVKSRGEAVRMIRKLNEKVCCCRMADHPGNDGSKFADDNTLYRFVPKEQRIQPLHTANHRQRSKVRSSSPSRDLKLRDKSATRDHHKGATQSSSSKSTKIRKSSSSPSFSLAKDAAYFKSRAQGVRDRLDAHRHKRGLSPISTANETW
jgi:Domain found in Dishevelled, Egl-10, and Pleckstrin (DEP)